MVIAAVVRLGERALAVDGAAEFAAPDDQRVVEQAALFQVDDQRRRGLIGAFALQREIARQVVVLVPAAMVKLDEAHVALEQAARQQAVRGIGAGLARVGAVQVENVLCGSFERSIRSGTEVCMRNAISYCEMRVSISGSPNCIEVHAIELAGGVEHVAARARVDARRIVQVEHRIAARAEAHALVIGGQKAAAPQAREERLVRIQRLRLREHHHEGRQVVILAAEAVADPRAHAGTPGLLAAALDEGDRRIVIDRVGVHRLDDRDVIHDLRRVRQQLADPRARIARAART